MPAALLIARSGPLIFAQQPSGGLYNSPANFASWSDNQTTHVVNARRAPDGSMNAALVTEDGTSAGHYYQRSVVTSIAAQAYTYSAYIQRVNGIRNGMLNVFSSAFSSQASFGFSLQSGAITLNPATTGSWSGSSAVVTPLPQGWFKAALTFTAATDTSINLLLQLMQGLATSSYAGDSASSNAVWGVDFR